MDTTKIGQEVIVCSGESIPIRNACCVVKLTVITVLTALFVHNIQAEGPHALGFILGALISVLTTMSGRPSFFMGLG